MKCPRCGYDNSPDATRCTACDARLPVTPPPRPEIVPRDHPIHPHRSLERLAEPGTPAVHIPISPAEVGRGNQETVGSKQGAGGRIPRPADLAGLHWVSCILGISPVLAGRVVARQMRWDEPPRDVARFLLHLAILVLALPLVLGGCASLVLAFATAALAVVCLGWPGLLFCTVPALGLLLAVWGLSRRPAPEAVPVLDLRVELARRPGEDFGTSPAGLVEVELVGARQGGDVTVGDEVEVWGRWERGGALRAWRVRLVAAGGRPIRAEVRASRPYSLPLAVAALLVAVLVNLALAWLLWPR